MSGETEMAEPAKAFLDGLFRTVIAAAHPSSCLPHHLPAPPAAGRLIVLAAGKAAGAMAELAETLYMERLRDPARLSGIAVARQGYGRPTRSSPWSRPAIRCRAPRAWPRPSA